MNLQLNLHEHDMSSMEEGWGGEWVDCPFGNGIIPSPDMLDMLIDGAPGTHTLMPATGAVARSQIIALPSLL